MDVELVLTFFDFHLSVIFITLGSNYHTSVDLNSVKTDFFNAFFPLPRTCHFAVLALVLS